VQRLESGKYAPRCQSRAAPSSPLGAARLPDTRAFLTRVSRGFDRAGVAREVAHAHNVVSGRQADSYLRMAACKASIG
jgi:hypothetical protein